jgi:uncharacterized protein (DUF305 family)
MPATKLVGSFFALVLLVELAACGGSDEERGGHPEGEGGDFNSQDVAFAGEMVPHHMQAVEMAALAEGRAETQEVLDLAADIEKAQKPEIDTMTGWLDAWGKESPEGHHSMEDMSEGEGMMTGSQLADLKASKGAAFDEKFLTMMIEHHEGAIETAKVEEAKGQYPPAIALAKRIQTDQEGEISLMESMLENQPG